MNLDEVIESFDRVDTAEENVNHRSGHLSTERDARNEKKQRLIYKVLLNSE